MPTPIVWLHGDSLSPYDAALVAHPAAPAVFVFDEPLLKQARLSFKRLMFIYESAIEALEGRTHELRRGVVVDEVLDFCRAHGGDEVHVSASVSPRFATYLGLLRGNVRVVVHSPPPLVGWSDAAPRRFSHFWRKVEAEALRPTGDGPPELREE
ncbi:MAG: deoxyribodipyrimidine photo-lyase [Chloroflexaceae bacterium]|nr:deoxyribodipyrimidine photo-lyase [Chloroflexaceae bacterium]NJL34193.1 deoxyribodipyrimidine photo-lyase [Chloroflexaceae bacterium]NJO05729.1 deoxyribodipyrimidine photo-lyase [Chloroflexaceae bacterium]